MKLNTVVCASFFITLSLACNKAKFDSLEKSKQIQAKQESPQIPATMENKPSPITNGSVTAETGTVTAVSTVLVVSTPANMIKAGGERMQASAKIIDSTEVPVVTWTISGPAGKADIGSIDQNGVYTSPANNDVAFPLVITATLKRDTKITGATTLSVLPKEVIFASCTQNSMTFPILAEVYSIPTSTTHIPDYANAAQAKKVTTVCMEKYAVEPRNFSEGFPNVANLFEYFSLKTKTTLVVPADGTYVLQLNSDDGARLAIDGKEVIDNDGLHQAYGPGPDESQTLGRKEVTLTLKKGDHPLTLNYFQGPKYRIALVLKWKTPGSSSFVYIPRDSFK
ncbi:MAG: hypothetical protein EOP07_16790 [Proteobacteria bacterium]|nr:MAG: hypothetical protein EOP07_16790 [Pseudomonadota bacterium]